MINLPKQYLEVMKVQDFALLAFVIFIFQAASSFVFLSLIVSVFEKTGSNFGVSGVILSFATPGFFLMVITGLIADLYDRKKVMLAANVALAIVVLVIILAIDKVFASISLSFLYFAAASFFLPASNAAIAQLVMRPQLLAANSVATLTLAAGQLGGLIAAAIVHFFLGNIWTLIICEALVVLTIWLLTLLPPLYPRRVESLSVLSTLGEIGRTFIFIFSRKTIWFFFLTFAFMQGLIAFGVTLAPGFFNDVFGISVDRSPIFVFPMVAIGVLLGAVYAHNPKVKESFFVALGVGLIGLCSFVAGLVFKLKLITGGFVLLPLAVLLTAFGFGVIISVIASRTVLAKMAPHNFQGSIFGSLVFLASLFASVMSPAAAGLEALIGYINILIFGGVLFIVFGIVTARIGRRWGF